MVSLLRKDGQKNLLENGDQETFPGVGSVSEMNDYYEVDTSSEGGTASVRTEESGKSHCAQWKKNKNFRVY